MRHCSDINIECPKKGKGWLGAGSGAEVRDMGRAMFSPALQQMLDSKQGHSEVNENNEIKSYIFRAEQILYWGTRQAGRAAKRPGQGAKEGGAPRNIKMKGKIVSERRNEQRITRRALR